jgi:hypothetical protein
MTPIPSTSNPQADGQQQSTVVARRSISTANNPTFRREYSNTFSHIEWGSDVSSLVGRPESDTTAESNTRTTQSSSWGQFSRSSSSTRLESADMPPFRGEIAPHYDNGSVVVLQVPTKGEARAKSKPARKRKAKQKAKAKTIDTSYLKLKEEYRKTSERPQRQSIADSSLDQCSRKPVRGSFVSVELPPLYNEKGTTTQQQQQQQVGTAAYRKNEGNEKDIDHQMREHDEDDDAESTGSKRLVQMIQEAENQSAANRFRRFPLWNSNLDNVSDLYAPRKQGRQPRLEVGFNSDGDDDAGGKEDINISAQWVVRCQVIVSVLSIVVGVVTCIVLVLALGDNALHADKRNDPSKEPSTHYSTNQQEMLQLAEQVTIACGVDARSGMSTCKELCHNHMCCVEQDDEYSCKNDVTKDCAVYAGCVALIDDNLWLD